MSDKRSVSTDALETLGTILTRNEKRDAIHIAVEPVTAAHDLYPGDDIGIIDKEKGLAGYCDDPLGIADPYIGHPNKRGPQAREVIKQGQKFFLLVYPRQITSLRHVWSHPLFEEEEKVA